MAFSALLVVSTAAAENFSAGKIELSTTSSKNIKYDISADAATSLWATNFTVEFDSDLFTLTDVKCDSRFEISYTVNGGKCTILLYSKDSQNVSVKKGTDLVTVHFTVSASIQPGEYSIRFTPAATSIVTYTGAVKDLSIDGGSLFYGNRITYVSKGSTVSSAFAASGDVIIPTNIESDNPDEIFIGWYSAKNSQHKKIFTAPGESFTLGNYDVTFEAVFLEFKTLPGASIYFPNENNDIRLRYVTAVNKAQYDFIFENIFGGDESALILGTLICPTDYATMNGGMNFDALKSDASAVQTSVPKAPGIWLDSASVSALGGSSKYYYYEGILSDIMRTPAQNSEEVIDYDTEFSAVAYLTLTYPSGNTVDHFAVYDPKDHSRSVRYVVEAALNDTSIRETDYYRFKIDDVYRPYSPSQTAALYKIRAGM